MTTTHLKHLAAALLLTSLVACGGADDPAGSMAGHTGGSAQAGGSSQAGGSAQGGAAQGTLTQQATDFLRQLREEEKLAHDVYVALSPHDAVFTMISKSEQVHFDSVGTLLTTYQIDDPSLGKAQAEFTSGAMQSLHDQLVGKGMTRQAALEVGAEIEELDIADIKKGRALTDAADVLAVLDRLEKGSRNHLREFHAKLTADGVTYVPTHLSQADYDAIVTSPHEMGP